MSAVPKHIKEKILTTDFLNSVNEFRRQHNVKIAASDPRLISFLSSYLGVPEEEVRKYSRRLIMLIGDVLSGRVKLKTEEPANVSGEPYIHVNTLANTLYILFYKLATTRASKIMYEVLEPYVVKALSGDAEALKTVELYFSPVSSSNYAEIIEQLRVVLSSRRELCSLPAKDFLLLCLKSSYLPVGKSMNSSSPVDDCVRLVVKAVSEVCHSGR